MDPSKETSHRQWRVWHGLNHVQNNLWQDLLQKPLHQFSAGTMYRYHLKGTLKEMMVSVALIEADTWIFFMCSPKCNM